MHKVMLLATILLFIAGCASAPRLTHLREDKAIIQYDRNSNNLEEMSKIASDACAAYGHQAVGPLSYFDLTNEDHLQSYVFQCVERSKVDTAISRCQAPRLWNQTKQACLDPTRRVSTSNSKRHLRIHDQVFEFNQWWTRINRPVRY